MLSSGRMKSTEYILVLLLANYCLAELLKDKVITKPGEYKIIAEQQKINNGSEAELQRQTRGWGSVIFTGFAVLVKAASLGLSLGNAITEGCMSFPSICSNKKEIERLERNIKIMKRKYDKEYMFIKERYYNLKTAATNNGYIEYYISKTMQAVQTIQDIEENLTLILEFRLPKLSHMAAATGNQTSKQYLRQAVGTLEYRISDLKKMLIRYKTFALVGLVLQFVIERAVSKFINVISAVKNEYDTLKAAQLSESKLKLVPQAIKNSVYGWKDNMKKWTKIETWKQYKGELMDKFVSPKKLVEKANSYLSSSHIKKVVNDYKLQTSQILSFTIGIVVDSISTGLQFKGWKDVSDKMSKARHAYQQYHDRLLHELLVIANETVKMEVVWKEVIKAFQSLSIPFKQLVENATNFSNFTDVIGLPKVPADTSGPLFSINFSSVTKESIISQQYDVIEFLKRVKNNMTDIKDNMRARILLYNNTASDSEKNKTVGDMLSDIKSILKFSQSGTIRAFGDNLTLTDIVCTVSILRYDLKEYDFFPIHAFRPHCNVNATTFELWKREAYIKRKSKLLRDVIIRTVKSTKEESLSKLLDAVHNAYSGVSDIQIALFGESITDQDVICLVAKIFVNQSMYDFINLTSLRPDCSMINSRQLHNILNDARKLRTASSAVKNALLGCSRYKFCPCLSSIASTNHVTEAEIEFAVKQINPSWQPNREAQFCGPNGCGCFHL